MKNIYTYFACRILDNTSPVEERPRSEPQVTSTETSVDHAHHNNNNNATSKYTAFEDLRNKCHQQQQQQQQQPIDNDSPTQNVIMSGLTQLDSKVGNSSDIKPDKDENKCFICKVNF